MAQHRVNGQLIALRAKATDDALNRFRDIGHTAKRLTAVHVGQMQLDRGQLGRAKGIEEGYELQPETTVNLFDQRAAAEAGVATLPRSLDEALHEMENSELVREALGEHIYEWFLRNRRAEWDRYSRHVTQFELDRYLTQW